MDNVSTHSRNRHRTLKYIVGNKVDKLDTWEVDFEIVEQYAEKIGAKAR